MRPAGPPSQSELQRQCGLHVVELQQGSRTSLPSEGCGHRRPHGRVQLLREPVWSDRPALWTALHRYCDGRGQRLHEQAERQCYNQDRYVQTFTAKFCMCSWILKCYLVFTRNVNNPELHTKKYSPVSMGKVTNFPINEKIHINAKNFRFFCSWRFRREFSFLFLFI